ncbi:cbb3-type cytochrome c oxidase subunit 3 [Ensifer soli]
MDYQMMRTFADSWGLLAMAIFFVLACAFAFRPGSKDMSRDAAGIPLKDE